MKGLVATLAFVLAASPALADPLTDAVRAGGGTACFMRSYDAAWLKAHPGQTLRQARFAMTMANRRPTFRMELRGAGRPLYLFGGCEWMAGNLNRGVADNVLDPGFKPTTGVGCHAMTDVTGLSAEEGGDFPIDWRDGRSIEVHLPDVVAAWRDPDVNRKASWPKIRAADQVIRLDQVSPSTCLHLLASFAPDEPR